jgi:hypothetical protein
MVRLLVGAVTGAVLLWPAGAQALKAPAASQVRLHRFNSCPALVSYARTHLRVTHGYPEPPIVALAGATAAPVGAKGAVGTAAPAASAATAGGVDTSPSPSFSTTNNQEAGVDEPDIAKTDGSTIFALAQGKLQAIAAGGVAPRLVGSLALGDGGGYGAQILLRGNRVIVISGQTRIPILPQPLAAGAPASIRSSPYFVGGSTTTLTEVDVSDPSNMKVTQTMSVDGRFVDARQSGTSARIVISSAPSAILQPQLAAAPAGWVPTWSFRDVRTGRRFTRPVASCDSIRRPVDFSGLGMLSIVTVDFDKGLGAAHSDSLMADAQIVYGSTQNLYVATQQWASPMLPPTRLPTSQTTVIDQFDLSNPDVTSFVASGEVPGYLLNQFSLSEWDGYLRVASTSRPIWWGGEGVSSVAPPQSQSYVTVLQTKNGVLAPVGQVSGLGQGEQIYSVRFVGDTGYVVTFRQVDPLYTIDLSTPASPRVVGQLDLEGYSAYLHPLPDGLLLGVGVDVASDTNEPTGAQVELFDVSNAASPKLLGKSSLGAGSSTQATYDHHAFLFWAPTGLAVLPLQVYGTGGVVTPGGPIASSGSFTGAVAFHLTRSGGIGALTQIAQDAVNGSSPQIERAIVIGQTLYTLSDSGIMASSLSSLARQAFVAFPAS